MLKAKSKLSGNELNSPRSPQLYDVVRTESIWKYILFHEKTKLSHHPQITFITKPMNINIDITWTKIGDIKQKLLKSKQDLNRTRVNAMDLRYRHLLQRISAKYLGKKYHSFKTIIHIQKI